MANKNFTPTGHYFRQIRPVMERYLGLPPFRPVRSDCPTLFDRLGMLSPSGKLNYSVDQLVHLIATSPEPTLFFPDTNFFSSELDDRVWEALLQRRIVITPHVLSESRIGYPRHFTTTVPIR